jgi:hypothetical protein
MGGPIGGIAARAAAVVKNRRNRPMMVLLIHQVGVRVADPRTSQGPVDGSRCNFFLSPQSGLMIIDRHSLNIIHGIHHFFPASSAFLNSHHKASSCWLSPFQLGWFSMSQF